MILFLLSEALKSILRSKASFILTVFSLTVSVMLIISSIFSIQTSEYLETRIKKIVKVNLFLEDSVQTQSIGNLEKKLRAKPYVSQITYISKEEAVDIFIEETGEDFSDILDYNPLPASFVVTIKKEFSNPDSLEHIISDLSLFNGVDEVVFKNRFVYRLLNFLNSIKNYLIVITCCVFLIALYLVYTTIKLIMNSKSREFETMKLVGSRLSTIKIPVLLNGLFAGIFASVICTAVFYFVIGYLDLFKAILYILESNRIIYLSVLIFTGPLLGIAVTYFTLRKLSLKI
jgi:cell division transport system permease protein